MLKFHVLILGVNLQKVMKTYQLKKLKKILIIILKITKEDL